MGIQDKNTETKKRPERRTDRHVEQYYSPEPSKRVGPGIIIMAVVLVLLVAALGFLLYKYSGATPAATPTPSVPAEPAATADVTASPSPTPEPTPTPFEPHATAETDPSLFFSATGIMYNGEILESYEAEDPIYFGEASEYTEMKGITTFRGNNFRDSASYGTADITNKKFGNYWTVDTASLQSPDGSVWTGSGWTGQPLIVEWPKETRRIMNMYDWAREADSLVEVIYATMDGNVYFAELSTGKATRDPLYLGFTFKGSGSLDPRGYPLLYVGSGYASSRGKSRAFVVSLIDGSVLFELGHADTYAIRDWPMFDGAPLIDAETDSLIWPGENGVIYVMKLNTKYDEKLGTISVEPSNILKWRYQSYRTTVYTYWLGMEDSAVIYQGHLIIADNGGNLFCLDLETMTVDWVQDVLDDTNCSPVLELEDGHPYIYISTSFHAGWRAAENSTAPIPIWKIDAETGEVVWRTDYTCYTVSGVSGGVQGTIALGKNNVSDLIFVSIARTGSGSAGRLAALSKETGEEVWGVETQMYSWGSPVLFYDKDGNGYIIYCTSGYYIYMFDAKTGGAEGPLDSMNIGGNVEASAAVYGNYVVVGTRAQKIYGIEIT